MAAETETETVLVTGGSGYLGQFVCAHLAGLGRFRVLYTFHENPVRIEGAEGFRVDLATGEGLAALTLAAAPAFIVNLAAVSQPRRCEANPAAAASVNAPTVMSSWQASLDEAHRARLLVHVSTDQVYGDSKPPPALYVEADPAEPVNAYGRSKLAAERLLADGRAFAGDWVALRSSVIFGPEPPAAPVNRGLFLQWMDSALRKAGEGEEEEDGVAFFSDEWRNPVFVLDVCRVVERFLGGMAGKGALNRVYNMGGPERLSRADMAEQLAEVRGHDRRRIRRCPAASMAGARGVASPADISMDSSALAAALDFTFTPFAAALRAIDWPE